MPESGGVPLIRNFCCFCMHGVLSEYRGCCVLLDKVAQNVSWLITSEKQMRHVSQIQQWENTDQSNRD